MTFWLYILAFAVTCSAFSDTNSSDFLEAEGGKSLSRRSYLSVDPNFEFKVYVQRIKTGKNFNDCLDNVFTYYNCRRQALVNKIKNAAYRRQVPKKDTVFMNVFSESARKMERGRSKSTSERFPATYLYTLESGAFSAELGASGTPGVWSCFFDKLIDEHRIINQETREMASFPDKLYSGIVNPSLYGITDSQGNLKVDVGSKISVSGFFSTSSDLEVALRFLYSIMGPGKVQKTPLLFFITPLQQSQTQAAYLGRYSYYRDQEKEYLFPTNVKFVVTNIESAPSEYYPAQYIIHVKETYTEHTYVLVNGQDPQASEVQKYMHCQSKKPKS